MDGEVSDAMTVLLGVVTKDGPSCFPSRKSFSILAECFVQDPIEVLEVVLTLFDAIQDFLLGLGIIDGMVGGLQRQGS